MRRPLTVLALAISVLSLASCGQDASGMKAETGVRGVVLAGPQCPVEQAGSPCPDEPMTNVEVQATTRGSVVATARTDAEGRFELPLEPGDYVIEAVLPAGPPSAKPTSVTVPSHGFAQVTVLVDTGIR
ncbi:MAG: MSCRAMM family protein [Solirubrobacterales bacterium]